MRYETRKRKLLRWSIREYCVSCVNLEFALDFKHSMNGFIKPICLPLEETMVGKILSVSSWRFTKLQVIAIVKTTTTKKPT